MVARHPPAPQTYRWGKAEYHQMWDLGWFTDRFVELIEGEVIETPQPSNAHCVSTDRAAEQGRAAFGRGFWVRMQMPLDLSPLSEPAPDVAVVAGERDTFTSTPTTALLVVEVSETALRYDRRPKAGLYARAGIADYWIVNLPDRRLEVHRQPGQDPGRPHGYGYGSVTVLQPGDWLSPLAAPQARIAVADLLP
jgi:Uma2 family endonuclease